MIPDPALQLQTVEKALREVVAPSIDPSNQQVTEQLNLSIATINLVRSRLHLVAGIGNADLEDAVSLTERLSELADGTHIAELEKAVVRGRTALDTLGTCREEELESVLHEVQTTISTVAADRNQAAYPEIALAVLRAAKPQIDRARAWCKPAGFEVDSSLVGEIEELLPCRHR